MTPRTYSRRARLAAFAAPAAALAVFCYAALAQSGAMPQSGAAQAGAEPMASVTDPPGLPPDPTRIVVTLPDQIKWTGNEALLYGTPNKPGDPYGLLVKLSPGQFSAPHTLANDRWVMVISGVLWVSSSASFDAKSTYPVKANTFVTDLAKTVFWDGNRAGASEPTTVLISGIGSADNRVMSEYSRKAAVSVNDPEGPEPDKSHITITPIQAAGNQNLYGLGQGSGGEGKPYGYIQTFTAGRSSTPHYHSNIRFIYVLQGPWWVSSSTTHDMRLTYPVPTGSFVEDLPHGIHWDGNRLGADYTVRLYIAGIGPSANHAVDLYGNDLPPRAGRGAPRPGR